MRLVLVLTEKPADPEPVQKVSKAMALMQNSCFQKFKPGDRVVYSPDLGSDGTFRRWRDDAVGIGTVVKHGDEFTMGILASRAVWTSE